MADQLTPPARSTVLVAEDEALIRLDLKEMLEEEGYEVVGEAGDGESAVRLTRERQPDLVILDIKMPGLDGLSAAERISAEGLAPVVVLTAFSQQELVERAARAGAMGYVVKPFQKADVLPAIEVAMARYREIRALERDVSDKEERLETRKLVDRAKGKLMDSYGMQEADAFRFLQTTAMDRRAKLAEVARAVIEGTDDVPTPR